VQVFFRRRANLVLRHLSLALCAVVFSQDVRAEENEPPYADTSPHEVFLQSIFVSSPKGKFVLRCAGSPGTSRVEVSKLNGFEDQTVMNQTLDEQDDCGQAVWQTEMLGPKNSWTLATLNPGRSGLNAKTSGFLIREGNVTFAGYIPVSASKIAGSKFRSFTSEGGSVWERIDELVDGKFVVEKELQWLMLGSLCISKDGRVSSEESCNGRKIIARRSKPICVEYRANVGRLMPAKSCAAILAQ
jgi:hypothetical protein